MHKFIAVTIVAILAFNVVASEGGVNEETPINGTDIESIDYYHVAQAGEAFIITVNLTEEAGNNVTEVSWITQVCINSGICYPPETHTLESENGDLWIGEIIPEDTATYINWRFEVLRGDENTTKVPENGFGWKIWSDCWYDGNNWGGNDSSCWPNDDSDEERLPGFIATLTLAAIGTAGLMTRRD